MNTTVWTAIFISLCSGSALYAQESNAVRLALEPGSQLSFDGTSTLHGFTCKTDQLEASIEVDPAYKTKDLTTLARPIVNVRVQIPVKSLVCGSKKLESNMFKTLRADEFPTITYVMTDYEVLTGVTRGNTLVAKTVGTLTVAGTQRAMEMRVESTRGSDGTVTAEAQQPILMTDYGIKPPTFMLGTLRVGNELKIHFTVKASPAKIAAAVGAVTGRDQPVVVATGKFLQQ